MPSLNTPSQHFKSICWQDSARHPVLSEGFLCGCLRIMANTKGKQAMLPSLPSVKFQLVKSYPDSHLGHKARCVPDHNCMSMDDRAKLVLNSFFCIPELLQIPSQNLSNSSTFSLAFLSCSSRNQDCFSSQLLQ